MLRALPALLITLDLREALLLRSGALQDLLSRTTQLTHAKPLQQRPWLGVAECRLKFAPPEARLCIARQKMKLGACETYKRTTATKSTWHDEELLLVCPQRVHLLGLVRG